MADMTKVYLLSVPLDKDNSHTLYFESAAAQQSYFAGKVKAEFDHFTYQRKDSIVRIPAHIDALYAGGMNYVMYQNPEFGNRWFYAFITDLEYKNDDCTYVTIKTDCLQTWLFDIEVKPCFVEREHAASDEIGEHTLEEGLELGEYCNNRHTKSGYASEDLSIVVGVSKIAAAFTDGSHEKATGSRYNGVYSGIDYYRFKQITDLNAFIKEYDEDGIGDDIVCMFIAPDPLTPSTGSNVVDSSALPDTYYINSTDDSGITTSNVEIDFSGGLLNTYVPQNNKLKCFPYRYLLVTNNAGVSVPLKYERFYTIAGTGIKTIIAPRFVIEGVLCPGCSIRMVPLNYNGAARNDEEGINMGKFPALNWTSDAYTNWLTQNGVNIALQVVSGVGQIAAGVAIAAGAPGVGAAVGGGSIVGGVSQIAGVLAQQHQMKFAPDQARGNLNAGDVVTASDNNDFHFYDMSITMERARVIDNYFSMYGYKCHRVKVPEEAHRESYWFTKTIDANIFGTIPQEDLQTIKDCYNKGITFWRATADFKNYGEPNRIVNG